MRASIINQYPRLDSTAERLAALLHTFASYKAAQFRGLTAFASETGLRLVEPSLRRFLDAGHSMFWIVGVDLGGTGRPALEFLYNLKREYPNRVDARVFSTGDNQTVFHPKVYWLDSNDRKVVVIGSANATSGGLERNFEASLVLDLEPLTDADILEELDFLWMTYTSPLPPLSPANLIDLNRSLINRFGPDHPPTDGRQSEPHPLAGMVPHRQRAVSSRSSTRSTPVSAMRRGKELLMDILQETRQTQVQLPVDVLASFFQNADNVRLQQVRKGVVVKSDTRPIIHLGNNTHRIEIDAIRGLPRPQIVRFLRPKGKSVVVTYEIVLNGTRDYNEAEKLLSQHGNQTRSGARRWLLR